MGDISVAKMLSLCSLCLYSYMQLGVVLCRSLKNWNKMQLWEKLLQWLKINVITLYNCDTFFGRQLLSLPHFHYSNEISAQISKHVQHQATVYTSLNRKSP